MTGEDMSPAEIGLALVELARTEPHAAAILNLIRKEGEGRACVCPRGSWARDANTASGWRCTECGEPVPLAVDPGQAGRAIAEALGAERPFRHRTRPGGGQVDEVARRAVDEALGAEGRGPFPPTYRVEGGSTRPVVHSEEAAADAAAGEPS